MIQPEHGSPRSRNGLHPSPTQVTLLGINPLARGEASELTEPGEEVNLDLSLELVLLLWY